MVDPIDLVDAIDVIDVVVVCGWCLGREVGFLTRLVLVVLLVGVVGAVLKCVVDVAVLKFS